MLAETPSLIKAAVLVPVYRGVGGDITLVLVRRAEGGVHGGQLAFPGGKQAPQDRSLRDTALREAREEIGLTPDAIEILDELPAVETKVSGFLVTPYLARIRRPSQWIPCAREVADVLEVSIGDLAKPTARDEGVIDLPGRTPSVKGLFYRVGDYQLWGATFRILDPLIPRLVQGTWEL